MWEVDAPPWRSATPAVAVRLLAFDAKRVKSDFSRALFATEAQESISVGRGFEIGAHARITDLQGPQAGRQLYFNG